MDGYINKKALLDFARNHIGGKIDANDIARFPCADVAPKSEYDAVVSAVDNSTKEFLKLHDKYQDQKTEIERLERICNSYAMQYGTVTDRQKVIDEAKAEVAREIFAEIEKTLSQWINRYYSITVSTFDLIEEPLKAMGSESALRAFRDYVAELKKKHTEN